jgi:hypothetical protein
MQLVDIAALVVGYGLAAVLLRAFWPHAPISPALTFFATGFYVWLGLAMSGPLLLLRRNRPTLSDEGEADPVVSGQFRASGRTWAEMAWLLIGVYWIVLGVFVLPVRLHSFRFSDTVLFGLVPLLAGLVFRLFGPRAGEHGSTSAPWTHQLAVALLATWPIAWLCLIVVGGVVL